MLSTEGKFTSCALLEKPAGNSHRNYWNYLNFLNIWLIENFLSFQIFIFFHFSYNNNIIIKNVEVPNESVFNHTILKPDNFDCSDKTTWRLIKTFKKVLKNSRNMILKLSWSHWLISGY